MRKPFDDLVAFLRAEGAIEYTVGKYTVLEHRYQSGLDTQPQIDFAAWSEDGEQIGETLLVGSVVDRLYPDGGAAIII